MEIRLNTPLTKQAVEQLKAGDKVLLSGVIYAARDAAHKKMIECIERGESLPFDILNNVVYYVGPTPPKPGQVIGSAGPTTSYRMDAYTPKLLELGLKGMIGKGERDQTVIDSMKSNGAVYFAAVGGAGALLSSKIIGSEVIAYEELGAESVRKLTVKDFPLIVAIDSYGNNLYQNKK